MSLAFEGKVVIVTGASRGLGERLTREFAGLGARVAFSARTPSAIEALEADLLHRGHDVLGITADVGRHADCELLVRRAFERWRRVDILVNNAGTSGVQKPIHELSYEEFDEVVRANQYSAYSCTHFAARHMVAQRSGVIVNISSIATARPRPGRTPYISSKRGMTGISSATAVDLGLYGIRCNTVSPGALPGVRLDEVIDRFAKSRGMTLEAVADEMVGTAALRRLPTEQDVCETVLFLCSDKARNISGQDIAVDAGVRMQ
jgi:3-oxoacyl-[acyl-carrier protein] reductase